MKRMKKNASTSENSAKTSLKKSLAPVKNFVYGVVIGAAMLIPGVSGGTTAIILGIYDQLVAAVASFFKDIKKNFLFLIVIALGGVAGILLFSKLLLRLISLWEVPMLFLFIGATSGSFPLLVRKSREGFRLSSILFLLLGFALVVGISYLAVSL